MNFDFSEDQKLLQQTARDFLEEYSPLSVCREVLESDQLYATELWNSAAEMGWQGAVIPEEYGGAGFGYLELAMIAQEVGRALAPIPFSSSVYLATEAILKAGSEEQKKRYLPRLASGESIGTLALVGALAAALPAVAKDKNDAKHSWAAGIPFHTDFESAMKEVGETGKMLFIYNGWEREKI